MVVARCGIFLFEGTNLVGAEKIKIDENINITGEDNQEADNIHYKIYQFIKYICASELKLIILILPKKECQPEYIQLANKTSKLVIKTASNRDHRMMIGHMELEPTSLSYLDFRCLMHSKVRDLKFSTHL